MRPPSYYTSIALSNDRSRSSYLSSDATRTSSQQLRSGLTSSSSSSYVNRSHLPYVPQSTLVAHCFTGVGSSTRPYGMSSSPSSGSSSSSSGYLSTRTSSIHSKSSYLPSSRPVSKRSASPYMSSASYNHPTTVSSYLPPRSAHLSSAAAAAAVSSAARYRPATSSYYKPIRLRERPLLTQISSRLIAAARSPSPAQPDGHSCSAEKSFTPGADDQANEATNSQQANESDWSQDGARNISRNKYLIKFREIDKPTRSKPLSLGDQSPKAGQESAATTIVTEPLDLNVIVTDRVSLKTAAETTPLPIQPKVGSSAQATSTTEDEELSKEQIANCDITAKKKVKKVKKKTSDAKLVSAQTSEAPEQPAPAEAIKVPSEVNKLESLKQNSTEPDATNKCAVKKERKNVKLKLKPIGAKKQASNGAVPKQDKLVDSETPIGAKKAAARKLSDVDQAQANKRNEAETSIDNKENVDKAPSTPAITKRKSSDGKLRVDTGLASLAKMKQQTNSSSSSSSSSGITKSARIRFREYFYDDFNFLSVLGHGGWGFVILAELKEHDACFAVKCIKKITIVEDDDYDSIMIERKVLSLGNINPFICKLFCTFETDGYLFFVMEYCAGGDLMFHVQREGKFTEPRSRFYAAEIICAIKFLHAKHIIYRDLKLDNILLDSRGHIRLVDFGMCQCRTYREEMLPSNFCGTPEYISPEIIKGVPYNHSVDWWSFGVLLYEMAVGKMPFRGNDENELLWNVCYEQIHYPMFLTKELTELLKLLLEREPTKRMGMATCKSGDIYDQPFFRGVNWKAVEELKVEPPFVPEVTSKRDVQNFDTDFTESACELSPVDEKTLAKIDQKQFQNFSYTNPDIFVFGQAN